MPFWFAGQRIVGTVVILIGAALVATAVLHFSSWRFRAALSEGHQLATGGPFSLLRHPIYMGLNLLALGSAIWVPSIIVWISVVLMSVGSDLRGRAEERLLEETFGASYREYCGRVRRFILKQNPSVDPSAFIGESNNVDESLYRGVEID